jgi:hypothetical protein
VDESAARLERGAKTRATVTRARKRFIQTSTRSKLDFVIHHPLTRSIRQELVADAAFSATEKSGCN